jgi:(p)ppGpp synthase/HD superfamily hydrolase
MDELVALARELAELAHDGQCRRDGVAPFLRHLEAVAAQLRNDPLAEAADWLHDALEDTALTTKDLAEAGIPAEVIEIVKLLTLTNGISYERYLEAIARNPVARRVKMADLIANLSDHPTDRQIAKAAKSLQFLASRRYSQDPEN